MFAGSPVDPGKAHKATWQGRFTPVITLLQICPAGAITVAPQDETDSVNAITGYELIMRSERLSCKLLLPVCNPPLHSSPQTPVAIKTMASTSHTP